MKKDVGKKMLQTVGADSLESLMDEIIPSNIKTVPHLSQILPDIISLLFYLANLV